MTRGRYALAVLAYWLGDGLEAVDCPTFARAVDWLYSRAVRFFRG